MPLKRRGRPKKSGGAVRSCSYKIRLTTYEEFLLNETARKLGISKADVLRKGLDNIVDSLDLTDK